MSGACRGLSVLFVTNAWPHEGKPWHGPHSAREVRALRAAGVRVRVLAIDGQRTRWAYAAAALELARSNRRVDFDLIHGFMGHAGVVARLHVRTPLVVTYTGSDLLGDHAATGVTRKSLAEATVIRQLARVASATITCAAHMEDVLPARCRSRNHVVPTSVPLDLFRPIPQVQARAELGWPPDERVVLFAADPARRVKNHPLALAAHEHLRAKSPDVRLRASAGVAYERMALWMSAADALLLTSYSEGSPGVVKEAMACELPVVSTPVGDVAAVMRGIPGCHVCAPDAEGLAAGLELALDHGRSPQARAAVAQFDVGPTARRVLGIYEQVLRAVPGGGRVLGSRR